MKLRHIINEMGSRMPSSMVKTKSKLDMMNPDEIRAFFKNREDFAAQHRGGKIAPGFSAKELAQRQEFSYGREFAKGRPYSKHFESTELDEGLKDWLQRMAAAGIIIGSVAGIGSINSAMDNSVPVIQAMNRALDAANQKGDKQLVQSIKQDIETAKISLDSGQNLNTVKNMQDRYSKFMPTEYKKENESFKDKIIDKIMSPIKDYNKSKESMLPKSAFAGSDKHKLGPAAHLTGTMKRPARAGDLVGGEGQSINTEEKQKGLDGKACWKGYRRMGTKMKGGKRVDNCVKYESKLAEKLANKLK